METVKRHSVLVRATHWLIALSGILLIFSGFGQMPMYKRYYITAIPGLGWSGDFEMTLIMHYVTAIIFVAAVVFHLVYHFGMKEFAIMPRKGDIKGTIDGVKAMFGKGEEPCHGKFQAKQRMVYASFGVTSLVLIVTGIIKTYKNIGDITLDPMFLQWMAMLHILTAAMFAFLFIAHVGALLLKNHRPMIPSMFSGRINKEYARKHHPAWKTD